ncbi:Conserved oligomeric Golgi complex, subunit 6 [Penicillium expansum]|uniref:Conserved oligomeric Golgi complex subunit 6 n=1 Tax=Penicillium expansum TaxID=27334 RepID=A0A0A2J578_PENEN|nr:Conserved oligomeric Golgi complex, subunit 6 [Penicillium expansum]KGO37831.1 Conserved oligomeric Golgi complex, subunit 6 [Penicillium expansum]KGO47735.1 Conserved oligomeric Golgi complex, subunit 6 [Penicillium expansum]KGO49818.1 Conserved oligomeric Golgi complex, subunit 6 [Penicillium expansum]
MTSYFPPSGSASNGANTPTASSPLSPPTQRPNALTNRLTSVLSASYADSDIRDSLETLSLRGIHNTAETRRQLRLDVQKEVVDCNAEIVKDFGKVAEQLRRIGTVVSTLNQTCDDMRKRINLAKQDTTPVLEEASTLMTQKKETETKQQLLEAFSKHFLVPEEDLSVLTSAEEPVDERFFDVLARVKQVHHDCEVLLGGENQRLGLEVMELSTRNLNSAYQKLYRWVQKEFRTLNLEDPRISSTIRRALRVLAERPSLFHSCLDFFAEARDYVLSDAFHYALTDAVSGANGPGAGDHTVKPIEFSAHDPLRYIGDMLAWVHSTTVSEREALESLFVDDGDELARGIQAGLSSEPWSRIDEDQEVAYDGQKALSDLVNRDLTGVSRSLRQRIELVIQSHEDPVTCYKVVNLLSFYRTTFTKLVGAQSHLVDLIQTLEKFTLGHFETLMRDQISALAGDNVALTPPDDLSPPQFLLDALEGLEVLMKTYEASVGPEDSSPDTPTDNPFTSVLRAAFDPFLTLARSSSDELQTTTAQSIYRTNILLTARAAISPFPFASSTHVPPISAALSTLRSDLLDTQHHFLLDTSGLETLLEALEPFSDTAEDKTEKPDQQKPHLADLASLPAFQPESLITSSQQLDDFLPSALMDATDNLKRIQSLSLIQSVTEDAVEAFCRDFEFVEGMIIAADEARGTVNVAIGAGTSVSGQSGKSDGRIEATEKDEEGEDEQWSLRSLFPRTTGEIRVLLS